MFTMVLPLYLTRKDLKRASSFRNQSKAGKELTTKAMEIRLSRPLDCFRKENSRGLPYHTTSLPLRDPKGSGAVVF